MLGQNSFLADDPDAVPGVASSSTNKRRGYDGVHPNLFILSDVCFVREGLLNAFNVDTSGLNAIAGATLNEAFVSSSEVHPRAILLDATFPDAKTIVQELASRIQQCHIIVLAIEEKADTVIEWAKLGVHGYVPRQASLHELISAVKAVLCGEHISAPAIVGGLLRHISQQSKNATDSAAEMLPQLTSRESQILHLLGGGYTNKDIARKLRIEVTTTKSHVHNILNKLCLQRRSQVPEWIQRKHRSGASIAPTTVLHPFSNL